MKVDRTTLPTKSQIEKKKEEWEEITSRKLTDVRKPTWGPVRSGSHHRLWPSVLQLTCRLFVRVRETRHSIQADVSAIVARKALLSRPSATEARLTLNRKRAEHTMSIKRKDYDGAETLAQEIAALEVQLQVTAPASFQPNREDNMAKLNEKNRKAQAEAIRKSENEKKEQRRLAVLGLGGEANPGPVDVSARVKTKLRVHDIRYVDLAIDHAKIRPDLD